METRLFDYELPDDLIAQRPLPDRAASRMLVVDRSGVRHAEFRDFPELVPPGSLVVLNDTRVHRARLVGARRGSGGRAEVLLLRRLEVHSRSEETWLAVARANRRIDPGFTVDAGDVSIEVVSRAAEGTLRVTVRAPDVASVLERQGRVPLPPYIKRLDEPEDAERYQTVYAEKFGSSAAPTAGLHFTNAVLDALRARDIETTAVTLHVGLGTFRPVTAADLDEHPMHAEEFEVTAELVAKMRACRSRGGKVVAIGTTVVRALESARDPDDSRLVRAKGAETKLLIQPGYSFGPVDALLTNFHMPRSTLIALVAAFAGRDRVLSAYRAAVEARYRFLSYGDAMWIPERIEAR